MLSGGNNSSEELHEAWSNVISGCLRDKQTHSSNMHEPLKTDDITTRYVPMDISNRIILNSLNNAVKYKSKVD